MNIKNILFNMIMMLFIDSIYLYTLGNYSFTNMIYKIQNENIQLNTLGVVGSYLFLFVPYYKFILIENKNEYDAFILGLSLYGVFNFTNIALFKKYNLISAITDTIWGGLLFYLTHNISRKMVFYI